MAEKNVVKEAEIFGLPNFSLPASQAVYENRGRKSVCAVEVTIPILSCGLSVVASIWARAEEKTDGLQIIPEVSMPKGKTVIASDPSARQRFMDHIAEHVADWSGYDRAMDQAENLLLNGKPKSKNVKAARALAPRLVKKPATAQEGQPTA